MNLFEANRLLPGGVQKQPTMWSCFVTCLSMVTGIDLDVMPLSGDLGAEVTFDHDKDAGTIHVISLDMHGWVDALRDSGFHVSARGKRPDGPSIVTGISPSGTKGHALVSLGDGTYADPANGKIVPEDKMAWLPAFYVVVTPM